MKRAISEKWETLIQRHLDGITSDEEVRELSERLESCPETRSLYLKLQQIHAILLNGEYDTPSTGASENRLIELITNLERSSQMLRKRRFLFSLGTIAAAVLVIFGCWSIWMSPEGAVVEIASIQGDVQWTGDGGSVIGELQEGQGLTGGTIETRSLNAVVELRFRDGTIVSTSGSSVLTVADAGQKKLYLRSGILSADVQEQPAECPMIIVTPTARLEILGTRLDVVANPERSKVSVRQGLVRAVRLSDGKSVKVAGGHSAIAATDARNEFLSRPSDQAVHTWQANLEQERKQGEGEFVSAMFALRMEIREALKSGKVNREQIRDVYGDRLAEAANTDGVLKAQPKQIRQSKFGNVIQIATLHVNRDRPNPVVLNEQSVFRVQGKVAVATEINIGFAAFGTTRASAGRFLASRNVTGKFDVEIPVQQFQPFRGRTAVDSAIGMEVFVWFCLTSDVDAELEISAVELKPASN
ncbi:MAG: FecR domain-containing protein [Planctomycetaceae bacterium]|nr:FecR domain-containing protein [Planctomycetaceae bacterium]